MLILPVDFGTVVTQSYSSNAFVYDSIINIEISKRLLNLTP